MTAFQKALVDSVLMEYAHVPEEQELEVTFSPGFDQWAAGFLEKQSPRRIRTRRVIRAVLIAAVLMALLVGTALAIPAVRQGIIEFFLNQQVDTYGITFDPEAATAAPNKIETVYKPEWIPEGFALTHKLVTPASANFWYTNSENEYIEFSQHLIPDDPASDTGAGYGDPIDRIEHALIGDHTVTVIYGDEYIIMLWTNDEYFYDILLPVFTDYDTMTQLVLNVQPLS